MLEKYVDSEQLSENQACSLLVTLALETLVWQLINKVKYYFYQEYLLSFLVL